MRFLLINTIAIISLLLCQGCQTAAVSTKLMVQELNIPAQGVTKQHHLSHTADGKLIASWVESEGKQNSVRFAVYDGGTWSSVQTVTSTKAKLAATPVVLSLGDGSLSAFWMEGVKNEKDRYAADIFWVRSQDAGQTWTAPVKPYNSDACIYDAQMNFATLPGNRVALVWTDSRFVNHDEKQTDKVKTSRYHMMATVLANDGQVGQELTLDDDVCSCCSAYTHAAGEELMTAYRDHLKGEIRDISAVRWSKGNVVSKTPVHNDHWVINGCPSNGPTVDFTDEKALVTWFSAGSGKPKHQLIFADGTGAFKTPIVVDDHAIGYGKAVLLDDGSALTAWRSNAGPEEELLVARVSPQGQVISKNLIERGSFPRWPSNYVGLEKVGDKAFVAWTDPVKKTVRLAAVTW